MFFRSSRKPTLAETEKAYSQDYLVSSDGRKKDDKDNSRMVMVMAAVDNGGLHRDSVSSQQSHHHHHQQHQIQSTTMVDIPMMLDSGPHRELPVDVPDSFIARTKTPPRYPPPKPRLQVLLSSLLLRLHIILRLIVDNDDFYYRICNVHFSGSTLLPFVYIYIYV